MPLPVPQNTRIADNTILIQEWVADNDTGDILNFVFGMLSGFNILSILKSEQHMSVLYRDGYDGDVKMIVF